MCDSNSGGSDPTLWTVGVVSCCIAACGAAVGLVLQKKALKEQKELPEGEKYSEIEGMVLSPAWFLGLLLLIIVPLPFDLVAFTLAPQSVVVPLKGGLEIMLNTWLAPVFLGEELSRNDWIGTIICIVGVMLTTSFGSHCSYDYDVHKLKALYDEYPFMVGEFIMAFFIVVTYILVSCIIPQLSSQDVDLILYKLKLRKGAVAKCYLEPESNVRLPSAEDAEGKAPLVITNKEGMEIAIEEGLAVDSYDEAEFYHDALQSYSSKLRDNGHNGEADLINKVSDEIISKSVRLSLCYGFLAGAWGGQQNVVLKATGELISNAIKGDNSDWHAGPYAYIFVGATLCLAVMQISNLNKGMQRYIAVKYLPYYNSVLLIFGTTFGGLYYQEYKQLTTVGCVFFPVGVIIILIGLAFLAMSKKERRVEPMDQFSDALEVTKMASHEADDIEKVKRDTPPAFTDDSSMRTKGPWDTETPHDSIAASLELHSPQNNQSDGDAPGVVPTMGGVGLDTQPLPRYGLPEKGNAGLLPPLEQTGDPTKMGSPSRSPSNLLPLTRTTSGSQDGNSSGDAKPRLWKGRGANLVGE